MTSICLESNFIIKASYDKPSLLNSPQKRKNKNVSMYNTSIFIGGHQNLKSKRIHLSTNTRYNNTVHREITNFRNKKNISVDRVNISLQKSQDSEQKMEQIDIIKMMNVRWQNKLEETRSDLSFINSKEKIEKKIDSFDTNQYIKDIINKINLIYNFNENNINQEYFILLKNDKYNENNHFIHEIIAPKSIEDIEKSVNIFMKRTNIQKNKDNNTDSSSSIDINKKKSKFSENVNINSSQNNNKENVNDNCQIKEEFCPVFILNQKDIKYLYNIIEPQKSNRNKNINYSINNFSINYPPTINNETILRSQNKNNIQNNENEKKKYSLHQINVENFELINNNDIHNESGNVQSVSEKEIENIIKENNQNNEEEIIDKKESIKSTEDFSQCTPLSLLNNKFQVYAVSKWIKYSIPNPQSELFIKNNFTSNKNIYEPTNLFITNFTLWIERIETKRNENKCSISISSSANSNTKNKSQQRGKSLTFNKNRHTQVKMHKANNYEMGSNGSFIKPINLKAKVFK